MTPSLLQTRTRLFLFSLASTLFTPFALAQNSFFDPGDDPNNLLSIEAENFHAEANPGTWQVRQDGKASNGSMVTTPDVGLRYFQVDTVNSPRLDYQVNIATPGTYYVWVLGSSTTTSSDSVHIGLNGTQYQDSDRISRFITSDGSYIWSNYTMDSSVATINIAKAGLHTLNLWLREDGFDVDKIVLTRSSQYKPVDDGAQGPAQSEEIGDDSNQSGGDIPLVDVYASDLPWVSEENGWGPVERDQANGSRNANDGTQLRLNGAIYDKGIGAHAYSKVVINLDEQYERFIADIGLDDSRGSNVCGSVEFKVEADGVTLFTSGRFTATTATETINIDVSNRRMLSLIITDSGDGICGDHGNWANAGFTKPPVVIDPDTDGDGIPDSQDAFPNDPIETKDSDGDGIGDNADVFPNDATETKDSDGDGVGDNFDAFPDNPRKNSDRDGDGVDDGYDAFPDDENETKDSDFDGIGDNADTTPYGSTTSITESRIPETNTVVGNTPTNFEVTYGGAASYQVPLNLPVGAAGLRPNISFNYNSQSGNGLMGVGWNVSTGLAQITECYKRNTSTKTHCLNGQELNSVGGGYYRTKLDSGILIQKINDTQYKLFYENGTTKTLNRKLTTPSVYLQETHTQRGGVAYTINWLVDTTNREPLVDSISYQGNEIKFDYEARSDSRKGYWMGAPRNRTQRLVGITAKNENKVTRQYEVFYEIDSVSGFSKVTNIQECAGANECLKPLSFEWSDSGESQLGPEINITSSLNASFEVGPNADLFKTTRDQFINDYNGDGIYDVTRVHWSKDFGWIVKVALGNGDGSAGHGGNYTKHFGDYNADGIIDTSLTHWDNE